MIDKGWPNNVKNVPQVLQDFWKVKKDLYAVKSTATSELPCNILHYKPEIISFLVQHIYL